MDGKYSNIITAVIKLGKCSELFGASMKSDFITNTTLCLSKQELSPVSTVSSCWSVSVESVLNFDDSASGR